MKRIVLITVMLCALVMAAGPAFAVSLSLQQGGTNSVDLVVSGLGNFEPASLGGFWADILYDDALLSITDADVIFGTYLGDPLDPAQADAIADTSTTGVVDLWELSWLDPGALNALQPSSFILATLTFSDMVDVNTLGLDILGLSDGLGTSDFVPAPVPEPATMLLLGTGLAGLAGFRKRFFKKQA